MDFTSDPQFIFQQAVQLHQSGRFAEAEQQYRLVINQHPRYEPALTNLGGVLLNLGKTRDAVKMLRKALDVNGKSTDALIGLAVAYMQQEKIDSAHELLNKAEKLEPQRPEVPFNRGNLYAAQGKNAEATQAFERTVELEPGNVGALINLGALHHQAGSIDKAAAALQQAALHGPMVPEVHQNLGNLKLDQGKPEEALSHFQRASQLVPNHPELLQSEAMVRQHLGQPEEALTLLERALQLSPDFVNALIQRGTIRMDQGKLADAIADFERVKQLDPANTWAEDGLRRARSRQLPLWHFEMLADTARNEAFRAAIEEAVAPESRVLDIGTGSGLLALMAARAGAQSIVACEAVLPLAEVATDIVKDNGFQDRITIHGKKSTDLKVGNELPEKANVLISEILDMGLLGEGVLPTFRHALANLLTDDAIVIPARAKVWAALVEVPGRRVVNPVKEIDGFDLSAFDRFRPSGEYVRMYLQREEHRLLSEPVAVWDVDFKHLPAPRPNEAPLLETIDFKASESGAVHAVAFWFDLYLTDSLMLSTRAGGELKHWGQAVDFLSEDVAVNPGDSVPVQMRISDHIIRFRLP